MKTDWSDIIMTLAVSLFSWGALSGACAMYVAYRVTKLKIKPPTWL